MFNDDSSHFRHIGKYFNSSLYFFFFLLSTIMISSSHLDHTYQTHKHTQKLSLLWLNFTSSPSSVCIYAKDVSMCICIAIIELYVTVLVLFPTLWQSSIFFNLFHVCVCIYYNILLNDCHQNQTAMNLP